MKLIGARALRRRSTLSEWAVVLVCSALVLTAGGRLVALSVARHATQTRASTQLLADQIAQALQRQLMRLPLEARQRGVAATAAAPAIAHTFLLSADGRASGAAAGAQGAADDIAAQYRALPAATVVPLLGPIRTASGWLVAARAPQTNGWAVAYRNLDELLVAAQVQNATRAGDDFELRATDPLSGSPQLVTGSANAPLLEPVTSAIVSPTTGAERTGAGAVQAWQLALRPKAGWYPVTEWVTDLSLLTLVVWLVALGVRDTAHHMRQLRAALAVSRRRLRGAREKLTHEIDQRLRLQKSFEHARYHDSFTGLPNRQYFLSQLDRSLREMRTRSGYRIAVLLLALDRFKVITDTLGRTAGDELMVQVTRRLHQALSAREHVLARWGDDELAVLLADTPSPAAATDIASLLQEALQEPIELRRHRVVVATSIGATCVESGLERVEEVLREADIALYSAKSPGSPNPVIYSAAMQSQLLQLVSLEGDLHAALQREEFRLMFQPIVDLRARHIVGVEVLLRWLHPIEGLLRPDRFLNFAEESGLIIPITRWIIQRACRLTAEWRERLPADRHFYTSINLSPAALLDPGLADHVTQVLAQTGTAPNSLKFELTENGLISNVGAARDALDRLHAMGIELMLDDFGTGYSSLSHLQLFPFDYIKIDGPIGSHLDPNDSTGSLIRAMAQMAATLGLKSIAEIVETSAAADALEQMGCEFAQGNAFCAPVSAEQAVKRLLTNILGSRELPEEPDSPTLMLPALPEEDLAP